ncbi:hypothetical protein HXX76_010358 [Chlamydomonas incerta]|uniref:Amidohydrolase 3 domain-containing protein n=1 Tax=Chlamydomonas incerta TaxID=51695 RepID=A0A835T0M0_CHLIN|nr:hypothetical protein HXX76_010358 [Chlamydomonas incerta]|eukprot:KAG2430260.1 hypothetical protein HXX76_010358 [Chlamydomonas incerta]
MRLTLLVLLGIVAVCRGAQGGATFWRSGDGSGLGCHDARAVCAEGPRDDSRQQRTPPVDTRLHVFYNGSIWTADEQVPTASILAVRLGVIQAVGTSLHHVLIDVLQSAQTVNSANAPAAAVSAAAADQEIVLHDLQGRFVMPGFVDAHTHIIPGGLALMRVQLRAVRSRAQWEARVSAAAAALGPGEWVLGGLWDESEWGGQLPSREWLDQVCGGRPAYVTRHDSHLGLANSAALAQAGINSATSDPDGGTIDRDPATGQPTGILRERAMQLVAAHIPEPSVRIRRAALAAAAALALSRGVTSVVDMGRYPFSDEGSSWRDLQEVYLPAMESGELPVRLVANVPLSSWDRLQAWVALRAAQHPRQPSPHHDASGRLFWGGLQEFLDGSLGSHTALLWEPYTDDPSSHGTRMLPDARLRQLLRQAVAAGFRVSLHAIGDRAVDEVAAACEDALAAAAVQGDGPAAVVVPGARFAIEHVQHISGPNTSAALARVARGNGSDEHRQSSQQGSGTHQLQVVTNPLHLLTDRDMLLPRLGPERAAQDRSFPFGALLAAGLRPAMASDWPVVDLQPLTSVYAAIHRCAPPPATAADLNARLPSGQRMEVVGVEYAAADRHHHHHDHQEPQQQAFNSSATAPGGGGAALAAPANLPAGDLAERHVGLDEALRAHTSWAAEAAGLQGLVGRLAVGLRADFIELDLSPAAMLPAGSTPRGGSGMWQGGRLPAVLRTWLDGALVYDQQQQAAPRQMFRLYQVM